MEAALRRRARSAGGKGVSYGAALSEAPNTHGLDVHIIGAGNSAGQAAMFFSTHARSVTIVYRGESLEKGMARYLADQIVARPNIAALLQSELVAAHGGDSIEAIDVRNSDTGETTRLETGGLFIFIGADAETAWLPPEIALDPTATCSRAPTWLGRAGSSTATPTSSRRAFLESLRRAMSDSAP